MKGPDRAPSSFKLPAATGLVLLRHSGLELVRPLHSLVALPVLAEHLERSGSRAGAADRIGLGRPCDLQAGATARKSGDGEKAVIHCIAEGPTTGALLEARAASVAPGFIPQPSAECTGTVDGSEFYRMLERAGFQPDARYRCVRRVAIGRGHLGFEVDLHRTAAEDGRFWTALISTVVLGIGWLLDPALSPSGFGMIWRIGLLRFDADAYDHVVRIDIAQTEDGTISVWARNDRSEPALGLSDVLTRNFSLAPVGRTELRSRAAGAGR